MREAEKIARQIRNSDIWDESLLKKLCELAGMTNEWKAANGDTFEVVANKAAEKLGVGII